MPYMIINLEYDRDIYLGKDTVVAYAWEEDKTCEYLEVKQKHSPAQVTEHCHVKLKDQEISQ